MDTKDRVVDAARPATADAMARLRSRSKVAGEWRAVLDRTWAGELTAAREAAEKAGRLNSPAAEQKAAQARLAELEALTQQNTVLFRFGASSPARYEELLTKHRPSAEQRTAAQERGMVMRWSEDFPAIYLHEVLIEPKLSLDECREIMLGTTGDDSAPEQTVLSPGEANELFSLVIQATVAPPRYQVDG